MFLIIFVFVCWLMGFALFWRMPLCRDANSPVSCQFALIIPARNEEANLPILLQSIAEQSIQPAQILVVNDHSTDRTAQIARDFGVTLLESAELPPGWRGKTWACHQGAMATRADHLMFLDADTRLEKEGLQRIVSEYLRVPGGAISVCPYHRVRFAYEQLSAFFNLIMIAGIGAFTIWPHRHEGMFGQMMMVSRSSYSRAGGHERIKEKILENLWLARFFRESATPVRCLLGKDVLSVRMYPDGIISLVEGWTKGFASGSKATAPLILLMIVAWLSGALTVTALFVRVHLIFALTLYALYVAQIFLLLRRIGSFRFYTAMFFPVPLIFFFAVFARSVIRSRDSVTWKGRVIHAD
jgi:4,4'-diaponeurosporenoate glycosyltransferase